MQIVPQGNKKRFLINRTNDAGEDLKKLHLVGTMHQALVFKTPLNLLDKTVTQGIIPTENIPTGILTITVFDEKWNAVAERITYVKNNEYSFETELEVQHWGLNKRARNEIQIKLPEDIAANLSVSVTDASIIADNSNNIFSHLLLTSDIKGHVHNPAYYFSANNEVVAQHLDLVMMTNGWRRFKWEDVVKEKYPVITHPKDSIYLAFSGEIYGVNSSLLRNAGNIVLITKTKDTSSLVVVPIGNDGKFSDPNLIFFDSLQVYYQIQSNNLTNAAVRFMPDRIAAPDYKKIQPSFMHKYSVYDTTGTYRQYLLSEERARLIEAAAGKMLENVTVRARAKNPIQELDERYTSGLFRGADSYQFDMTKEIGAQAAMNIFSFLQGRVAGLQIQTSGNNASLQWRGGTPSLYVDETPSDVERVLSLPVNDIAYVKVFRPPFIGSFGGGSGGAIAIYTKKGGDQVKSEASKLKGTTIVGYTPYKEFYSPNYSGFDPRNEERDIRTTLYWNPMIITSPKKNIVTFSFYNNDVTKSFRVVIEGISKNGQLTHYEQILE